MTAALDDPQSDRVAKGMAQSERSRLLRVDERNQLRIDTRLRI